MEANSSQAITPTTNERMCIAFRVCCIPTKVLQKFKLDSSTSTNCLWHLAFYVLSRRLVLFTRGIRFIKGLDLR